METKSTLVHTTEMEKYKYTLFVDWLMFEGVLRAEAYVLLVFGIAPWPVEVVLWSGTAQGTKSLGTGTAHRTRAEGTGKQAWKFILAASTDLGKGKQV